MICSFCVSDLVTDNVFGRKLSIWDATKFISKWRLSHMRGYHMGIYSKTEAHKNLLKDRELECKASVRAPVDFFFLFFKSSLAPPCGLLSSVTVNGLLNSLDHGIIA